MSSSFARIEARINETVSRRLSNAMAVFNGGEPFRVIFDREQHESLDSIGGYAPSCGLYLASAPGLEQDDILHIDGSAYAVAGPVEPDSSGWVTLQLRTAGGAHG